MSNDWTDNYRKIVKELEKSNICFTLTDEICINHCKRCEKVYGRLTIEHVQHFKSNDYEGNVDEQFWYRCACVLRDNGYDLSKI